MILGLLFSMQANPIVGFSITSKTRSALPFLCAGSNVLVRQARTRGQEFGTRLTATGSLALPRFDGCCWSLESGLQRHTQMSLGVVVFAACGEFVVWHTESRFSRLCLSSRFGLFLQG